MHFLANGRVSVYGEIDGKIGVAIDTVFFVQQVCHGPVAEHLGEGHAVSAGFQVSVDARNAVGRFHQQRSKVVPAPVVLGQVAHEQRGGAVVLRTADVVGRPLGQRGGSGATELENTVFGITGNGHGQFREALVHPGLIGEVGIPVHGVLKLVGQHPGEPLRAYGQITRIYVDGLDFVAHGANFPGILVRSVEVTPGSSEVGNDHVKMRVPVNAGGPLRSEGPGDRRVNDLLEFPGG